MIRNLQFRDLEFLQRVCQYEFPNLSNGLFCSQKALIDRKGRLVGGALLKLTSEAMIILDPDISPLIRANAIQEAFSEISSELDRYGLEDVQVNVIPENDEKYAEFLIKNFNFEKGQGIPLILRRK